MGRVTKEAPRGASAWSGLLWSVLSAPTVDFRYRSLSRSKLAGEAISHATNLLPMNGAGACALRGGMAGGEVDFEEGAFQAGDVPLLLHCLFSSAHV